MVKTFFVDHMNYILFALLVLANIYGGIFSLLSGICVGFLMLLTMLCIAAMGVVLYTDKTNVKAMLEKKDKKDENQKIVNRVVAVAICLLIFTLHWYTVGVFFVLIHAIFLCLYYVCKNKFLEIAEKTKENPGA